MKKIIILPIALLILANICSAQYINPDSDNNGKRHTVFLNSGYDYSLSFDAGYMHAVNILNRTVLLGLEFSVPMGDKLFDDQKIKIGGEAELFHKNNFHVSARIQGVVRRYMSDYVRIENFGSDLGLTAGFYRRKAYIAGEFGFDKAITSHLKHTAEFQEIYPQVVDGWFMPVGGQFYYGLSTGFSLGSFIDMTFKAGMTNAQGKDVNALLPFYGQLGLSKSF